MANVLSPCPQCKKLLMRRGNHRQIIERWAVIIAGIVMVIAGAEKADQKKRR